MNDILKRAQKYNTQGPRYTSYPTVPQWTKPFGEKELRRKLTSLNTREWIGTSTGMTQEPKTLSLYTHIPFCEEKCYFCACNVVITKQKDQADLYLKYLKKELDLISQSLEVKYLLTQYHWGGGTPTYLTLKQLEDLFLSHLKRFKFSDDAEISLEIDPRVTTFEQLKLLRELGFNRVSMGVQDFDPKVQSTINRNQTEQVTRVVFNQCRELGFKSINMDFVYGLPYQTEEGFEKNLKTIIEFKPDRIAFYNYAHVPWIISYQKLIPDESLPSGELKIKFFLKAKNFFQQAGYEHIGMDHFASFNDELVQAQREKTLRRNFMGYTVQKDALCLALGVSSISDIEDIYVQNHRKLSEYYKALDHDQWPVSKGHQLSKDDLLRRSIIMELMCNLEISISEIERRFSISFLDYFSSELCLLQEMVQDGLMIINPNGASITSMGRLFIRNICMVFDSYLKNEPGLRYSKTI